MDDGILVVQPLILLSIIANLHTRSNQHLTLTGRCDAEQDAQQRGFACPIESDDNEPLPALDLEADMAKNLLRAIPFGELLRTHHQPATCLTDWEVDVHTSASLWE